MTLRARAQRGITLIELMVVVALMAIVISLVAPSMRELLAAQRVQSINAELVGNLQYARAEAVRRNLPVFLRFSSNSTRTCYVIYLAAVHGTCNCLYGTGTACTGDHEEIRTVVVPRTLSVALAASSSVSTIVNFDKDTGRTTPNTFTVDVASTVRGTLRTTVNATGRPTVCSPDGSIRQVPQCS
jgi:prepilin-type N-terminal cleavage/methylation domain-containing protein